MIHTVKGFGVVNKAEADVFLELSCFLDDQQISTVWSLVPLPFKIQLEHREVLGSHTAEAWLGEFWALLSQNSLKNHSPYISQMVRPLSLSSVVSPTSCAELTMQCWASLVAQMVKNLPAVQETWVWSLSQEDPLKNRMASHSIILAWGIPWTEEPGRLQSMRSVISVQIMWWQTLIECLKLSPLSLCLRDQLLHVFPLLIFVDPVLRWGSVLLSFLLWWLMV